MFEDPLKLLLGLMTGIVFGVLLQKGQVAKFQKILGQFLLQDFTVIKIMATAIAVGTSGVHALIAMGTADLHVQTASLARVIGGGILFGVGLAVFGLCPGTSVAAGGEGRRDAMVGVVGMMERVSMWRHFPLWNRCSNQWTTTAKSTLPHMTNSSPWIWAVGLALVIAIALALLERARARNPRPRG